MPVQSTVVGDAYAKPLELTRRVMAIQKEFGGFEINVEYFDADDNRQDDPSINTIKAVLKDPDGTRIVTLTITDVFKIEGQTTRGSFDAHDAIGRGTYEGIISDDTKYEDIGSAKEKLHGILEGLKAENSFFATWEVRQTDESFAIFDHKGDEVVSINGSFELREKRIASRYTRGEVEELKEPELPDVTLRPKRPRTRTWRNGFGLFGGRERNRRPRRSRKKTFSR